MPEETAGLTAFFDGPLSFSSMAAQALLHYGIRHASQERARWRVTAAEGESGYDLSVREGSRLLYGRKGLKDRRACAHALMDGLSALTGIPLGKWGYLLGMRPEKALYPFLSRPDFEEAARHFLREEKVSPEMTELLCEAARAHQAVLAREAVPEKEAALYLHVPFCPSHCVYCSFPAAIAPPPGAVSSYAQALSRDASAALALAREKGLHIESVYMGGGTPSVLSPRQMDQVLGVLTRGGLSLSTLECTVEAGRPDTITETLLQVLAARGVSRISINPQTMQDRILRRIARAHTKDDIFRAFRAARRAGFAAVNMDFICGLPGETLADMNENLDVICQLRPENVTIHTLAVKRGSPFYGREEAYDLPPAEEVEAMLGLSRERLREAGYHPYYLYRQKYMTDDFANVGYALPGHDSVYNIQMIGERQHVIGAGAGAVSKRVLPGGFRLRKLYMPRAPELYEKELPGLIRRRRALWDGE